MDLFAGNRSFQVSRCVTVTENVSVLVCVPVSPAGEGNPVINHHVKISATATEEVSVLLQISEYNSFFQHSGIAGPWAWTLDSENAGLWTDIAIQKHKKIYRFGLA